VTAGRKEDDRDVSRRNHKSPFREDFTQAGKRIGWTYILLNVIVVFLVCQQNLDAPNLSQIGRSFSLTGVQIDARIGGEAFMWQMIVASISLIVFGYLADQRNRKVLLVITLLASGLAYLVTPLARTVDQFIVLRSLAGIGIGGIVPVMFSVLGDLFTARSRAAASGIFMAVGNVGYGNGFVLGSLIGSENALGWKASFMVQSLILLALAALFMAFGRLPERGWADMRGAMALKDGDSEYRGRIKISDVSRILTNHTNLIFIVSCLISSMPLGYIQRFMVDYFAGTVGMGAGSATLMLLLVLGGSLGGDLMGGVLGDVLRRKDRRYPPLLAALVILGGCILFYAFFVYPLPFNPGWKALAIPIVIGFCAAAFIETAVPLSKAIMLNVNVPENRGTISALIQITAQIGYGLGALIGVFGPACAAWLDLPHSHIFNFKLAVLIWIPVALSWLIVIRTAPRDEERMERLMQEKMRR
jgi:MFS family permease